MNVSYLKYMNKGKLCLLIQNLILNYYYYYIIIKYLTR